MNRSKRGMQQGRRWFAASLSAAVTAALTAACGPGPEEPRAEAVTMPASQRVMGDWFAYESTTTQTVGGSGVSQTAQTRYVHQVNVDGSSVRVDSYGAGNSSLRLTRNYDGQQQQVSNATLSRTCTYSPSLSAVPPPGTPASQAHSFSSVENCAAAGGGTPAVGTLAGTATVQGAESRTTPLGTFSTVKYQTTYTYTPSNGTGVTRYGETCWVDRTTGRSVDCSSDTSFTPAGQSTPSSASTQVFRLAAYSFNGAAAVGTSVRRFAGTWDLALKRATGSTLSNCTVQVDLAGLASGTCPGLGLSNSAAAPPTTLVSLSLAGNVSSSGAFSLNAPEGLAISGSLTSPIAGSGNWVSTAYLSESTTAAGVNAGSWTAAHR